jgi:hypothetical protein
MKDSGLLWFGDLRMSGCRNPLCTVFLLPSDLPEGSTGPVSFAALSAAISKMKVKERIGFAFFFFSFLFKETGDKYAK